MAPSTERIKRVGLGVALLLAISGSAAPPSGAQAPDEAWRTLRTEHFRVNFPVELEALARRAGDRAEWAWNQLSAEFIDPPDGVIDILLTDHTDRSNGFAQVTPGPRMTIFARPPVDALSLSYTDEWLELVILHELAHVIHLDHVINPIGRAARSVFGRVSMEWPFFPELGTPRWLTEGLATWYESRLTQAGRVRGTFEEMQIRTAVLEGRFEHIDQGSGNSPLWPAGNRPYAYGSIFFDFLLERHGEERMSEFADAIAGQWIPYRLDGAGRSAFGVSLTDEWAAWRESLERDLADLDERLSELGPISEPERLTEGARWGLYPEASPDGTRVAYNRSDGRSDLQMRVLDVDARSSLGLGRLNSLGPSAWLPDGRLLVAQIELEGPYRSFSDLWIYDMEGGQTRVTEGARLTQPGVGTDGTAWAIAEGNGTNSIVRVDLESGDVQALVEPDPDVHWAYPRPSPDGRWLAAARWEPDGYLDVVILDAGSGRIVSRVTDDRALDTSPTWSRDGRWLVWASDRTGIFNIVAAQVDADGSVARPRLLTNLRTGGAYPSVDPQGRWLYFSGYHVDGWDVERVPFAPERASEAGPVADRFDPDGSFPLRGAVDAEVEDYNPLPTLAPSYWELAWREPVVVRATTTTGGVLPQRELLGAGIGLQSSGYDIAGRHAWSAIGRVTTSGGKVEGGASYSFFGLGNPVLSLSANQRYDGVGQLLAGTAPDQEVLLVRERTRDVSGAVTFLAPKWRYDLALTLGAGVSWESRDLLDLNLEPSTDFALSRPRTRTADASATISFNSRRSHAFQLGSARGISLLLQGRVQREIALPDSLRNVAGLDRALGEVVGRARGSLPLWSVGRATHVLAIQAVGGFASGPGAGPFQYGAGGAAGQLETLTGLELFGGQFLLFPVRGYAQGVRTGRFAWSTSAEYRFPLLWVNRGFRAWPVFIDRVVGAFFFDAGNAWGPDVWPGGVVNPRRDPLASVGGELTTAFLGLYDVQLNLRLGAALPLVQGDGVRGYVRVGLPF